MAREDSSGGDGPTGGVKVDAGFGPVPGRAVQTGRRPPPCRILVVGRFGARDQGMRCAVERAELASLPARLGVRLDVVVPNRLGRSPAALSDRLVFESLGDFAPARIARRFAPIAEARRLIEEGGGGGDTRYSLLAEALRQPAAPAGPQAAERPAGDVPPPAPGAPGDADSIDRLLGMVEHGTSGDAGAPKQAVSTVISAIAGGGSARSAKPGQPAAEALLAAQHAALFEDATLRELLEAWQGLRLLAGAIDPQADLRLDVIDSGADDPAALIARELGDETAEPDGPEITLIVLASRLTASQPDFERARTIARVAQHLQAPAVVSFAADPGAGFDLGEAARRDEPGLLFDGRGFESWASLRDDEAARWLVMAWNDVLARGADADGPALWIAPAWIVAAQVARSIAGAGWPSEIVGRQAALAGFDVHEIAASGRRAACATRVLLQPGACRSLADAGVLALGATPDRDDAFCVAAPTVHRPGRFPDDPHGRRARLLSSLPYQLAAVRLARLVEVARADGAAGTAEAQAGDIEARLTDLLAETGPGARVEVGVAPHPDDPARQVLTVDARTGQSVLGGEAFAFDLPL